MPVTELSPSQLAAAVAGLEPLRPRLLDVEAAAAYLGVSVWTVRDYVANGTIPAVRLPAARLDFGRRPRGQGHRYVLVRHDDPRLGAAEPVRRILIDVRDLDALIERSKEAGTSVEGTLATASTSP